MTVLVDVAVLAATFAEPLTYAVPQALIPRARAGTRVVVPLGTRRVVGLLLGTTERAPQKLKLIESVIDDAPVVTPAQLQLCSFVARYYLAPIAEAARLVLPPDTDDAPRRRYALTEAGEQARVLFARHDLKAADVAFLASFEEGEVVDERMLKRRGATRARVVALQNKGLIEERTQKAPVSLVRTRENLVPVDGGTLPRGSPALQAFDAWVRAFVQDQGRPPSIGEAQTALPDARGKARRLASLGRLRIDEEVRGARTRAAVLGHGASARLLDAQQAAVDAVVTAMETAPGTGFLLEGVTGSGKTEVYLHALRSTLARGKGAILLVPEIALTPQLLARVESSVDEEVVVLHSGVSMAERRDALARLREGRARVVVGARSAIFAPVSPLGLIIVDEEHEPSLKQEESPRYHARDVALWRAKNEAAVCVLGSATPSLESRFNVEQHKLVPLALPVRFGGGGQLPGVELIDLRVRKEIKLQKKKDRAVADDHGGTVLSGPLVTAMAETLAASDQVLLFLNRRGYASSIVCEACGEIRHCPQCSVSLTLHERKSPTLVCHQCGYIEPYQDTCPSCGTEGLIPLGTGTERVEAEVRARFPDARIARLDRDTTKKAGELVRLLRAIQERAVDIIIGTQMVAKGHDWPSVALVGVVLADIALSLPDFRASERAMSLLTQVAGRAGRGQRPGRVLVQTYAPEHPALRHLVEHDVRTFADKELQERRELQWPPFSRAALLRVEAEDEPKAADLIHDVAAVVKNAARACTGFWKLLGPAPCPIERIQGRSRFQLLLRTQTAQDRATLLQAVRADPGIEGARSRIAARLILDVDPLSML